MTDCGPILIVDDDADFRAFVALLFSEAGYATQAAGSGKEALAAVGAERPSLVLLDIALPDISGFEICHRLRNEFGNALPIIFVSGERVEPVDRAVGLLLGGDDYVVKPFDADELLARARRAIARTEPEQPNVSPAGDFGLTKRELEVLQRFAGGEEPAEIASELVISPKTVACHLQRVLAKLGVHSRAQAVAVAYQSGLLERAEREPEDFVAHSILSLSP